MLDNSYCEFLIKENLIDPFNWEIGNAFLEKHSVKAIEREGKLVDIGSMIAIG